MHGLLVIYKYTNAWFLFGCAYRDLYQPNNPNKLHFVLAKKDK